MSTTNLEWFTCAISGVKFQYPNGAKCSHCRQMVHASKYIYVDMDPVCLDCKKKDMERIMETLKAAG